MLDCLEAKNSIKSEDFRMASLEEKAGELSILEENVPRGIGRMCFVNIYSSNAPLPAQYDYVGIR